MALCIRNSLDFKGLLYVRRLMLLNLNWDGFLSVKNKQPWKTDFLRIQMSLWSGLWIKTFQCLVNLKQCYPHTASTTSVIFLLKLFDHIWFIVDPFVTVIFFLSVLFYKVIYLLKLLILLQHCVIVCPSLWALQRTEEKKMTRTDSQRAVCQQQCWLCKDRGRNSSCATIVYGL